MKTTPACLVALLGAACAATPADFRAGSLELALGAERSAVHEPVPVTLVNRTPEDVFVSHCANHFSLAVERRVDGTWLPAYGLDGPVCPAIYSSGELHLAPGQATTRPVAFDLPGEYRLVVYGRRARDDFGSDVARSAPLVVEAQ